MTAAMPSSHRHHGTLPQRRQSSSDWRSQVVQLATDRLTGAATPSEQAGVGGHDAEEGGAAPQHERHLRELGVVHLQAHLESKLEQFRAV